jgi:hypothetical protein
VLLRNQNLWIARELRRASVAQNRNGSMRGG